MITAQRDYLKFLAWLHQPGRGVPQDTLRFASLVLAEFPAVARTTNRQSQRSAGLAGLARQALDTTAPLPPVPGLVHAESEWPWQSLASLKVGPFRGFRTPETFHFPKRITLFSGPNGSGKTSLCEALEHALLGSVDVAGLKRIAQSQYLANIHEVRFTAPALVGIDAQGQAVAVQANNDAFRFCFVEKHRIDNFSHIASKTAGEKTSLIAALFGMDQFYDFVANFNESMDGQLALNAVKLQELTNKRSALAQDQVTVAGEQASLAEVDAAERAYAHTFSPGLTYAALLFMIGTVAAPGRLQELNAVLDAPALHQWAPDSAGFLNALHAADACQKVLEEASAKLAGKAAETSFQNLYRAILVVQALSPEHCPACGTSLGGTPRLARNPYAHAHASLEALRELGVLQAAEAAARRSRDAASRTVEQKFQYFAQRVAATPLHQDPLYRYLAQPGVDYQRPWWQAGYLVGPLGTSLAQQAVDLAKRLEKEDEKIKVQQAARQQLVAERDKLNAAALMAVSFRERRNQIATLVASARQRVSGFEAANAALIAEVDQEQIAIARDAGIKTAYDGFLRLLKQFRTELPGTLIAGLNTMVMELYNEFNVRDADSDKLADLLLPVTSEGRIELSFRGKPDRRVDALQVLSEGHVRCLGVAILLAKALSIRVPVIVFDDAINAIDTEHRQGIREAIFESGRFRDTQTIVTCHSPEFIKDIQNHVAADQWTSYYFMPHPGNYHPRIVGNEAAQGYLVRARNSLAIGDQRSALGYSRQALEMLTSKVWSWLGKHDHGMLTLLIAGKGAEPGLRSLCEALRTRLRDLASFVHPDKTATIQCLEAVLGVPAPSNVWLYLNKGIHEEADRDDYDPALVERIVANLEALNALTFRKITIAAADAAQAAAEAAAVAARGAPRTRQG
ncbi:MAG: AAA family ATPase [Paucibacter sp.]|nr:AAA family ATPase [Roseateles sp.]